MIFMPGNSFGERFRVTTAGVSHGPGYLCIIDGCPPGLPLSADDLLLDLRRRRPGQSKLVTQRDEADVPEIWSGIFEGVTDGTPIGILFCNSDGIAEQDANRGAVGHALEDARPDFRHVGLVALRDEL